VASFRSFLARERLVPVEQLDRALQRQILYGEDLSVNLLEIGAVDEDELAQFLGMFYRLPIVTRSDLDSVETTVAALIPPLVALKHRVCPLAVADDAMVVAAARPLDRDVTDDLARVTGHSISTVVAAPMALAWGLHRHYGEEFPARYQRILDGMRKKESEAAARQSPQAPQAPQAEEPEERPRRASGIIVLPGDLPESEERKTEPAQEPMATASATTVAPPPPPVGSPETSGRPVEPPAPGTPEQQAADDVLKGISLSHDNAADRLIEMVLGRPTEPPPPLEPEPASPPGGEADAVVAIRGVVVGAAEGETAPAPSRSSVVPAGLESLVETTPSVPPAPATGAALLDRIAHLDHLRRPYDVLKYTFYLFSAGFRTGLLIDATGQPRIREAFGLQAPEGETRGRPLPDGILPQVVHGAAQPLLTRIEENTPLAAFVTELFGGLPRNALFLPVVVGHRVVAILYGDNRDATTSFEQVRDFFHLAWAAGERLAKLARERRRSAAE